MSDSPVAAPTKATPRLLFGGRRIGFTLKVPGGGDPRASVWAHASETIALCRQSLPEAIVAEKFSVSYEPGSVDAGVRAYASGHAKAITIAVTPERAEQKPVEKTTETGTNAPPLNQRNATELRKD
ncbi:MAG: hypothetical protein ABSA63_02950 [Thermoplasmata archaeon]|jgi:hypothetical protein